MCRRWPRHRQRRKPQRDADGPGVADSPAGVRPCSPATSNVRLLRCDGVVILPRARSGEPFSLSVERLVAPAAHSYVALRRVLRGTWSLFCSDGGLETRCLLDRWRTRNGDVSLIVFFRRTDNQYLASVHGDSDSAVEIRAPKHVKRGRTLPHAMAVSLATGVNLPTATRTHSDERWRWTIAARSASGQDTQRCCRSRLLFLHAMRETQTMALPETQGAVLRNPAQ
jgi:hypothetical protein